MKGSPGDQGARSPKGRRSGEEIRGAAEHVRSRSASLLAPGNARAKCRVGRLPPRTTLLTEAGGGKCGHGGEGVGNPRRPYAACRWALAALEASPMVAMPARRPRPRTHTAKTRKHVADKTCPRLFAAACSVLARRWGIPRRLATAG